MKFAANDMALSQEDQPRTHSTVREISRKARKSQLVKPCAFWGHSVVV